MADVVFVARFPPNRKFQSEIVACHKNRFTFEIYG